MLNDKLINQVLTFRYDSSAYNRLQIVCVVGHSVGAHTESYIQGVPKKRIPNFIFRITSVIQHRF